MKKVITALLNKTVNEKLKNYNEIKIEMNDIQYQEGIIEALEINNNIEYIILSELLPGNYNIKELIEKIKKKKSIIKIIIILEKENKELENYLLAQGNINIFYNNQIKIEEIAKLIINENKNEQLEMEIKKLKELIINKDKNNENNLKYEINIENKKQEKPITITNIEKKQIEEEIEEEYKHLYLKDKLINKIIKKQKIEDRCKTIIVSGIAGVGKSVFTVNLTKELQRQKKKVIIIDFDILNNSIKTLFGIKNKNIKIQEINNNFEKNIEENIIEVNSKIKLISNINFILDEKELNNFKFLKLLNYLKKENDYIIIDLNDNIEKLKDYIQENDKIIFITEANILQIKKSKKILEKYINEYKISNEKIYILFNKIKSDCLGINILKEIFKNYNIIGKINFIKNCNILINQNMKSIFLEKNIKKQYKKITKRILENNKIKEYYLNKILEK